MTDFAIYYRPRIWNGPWVLFCETASPEGAHRHERHIFATLAPSGEVAIFANSSHPVARQGEEKTPKTWPLRFTEGNEPGRLLFQITAVFRRVIDGVRLGG